MSARAASQLEKEEGIINQVLTPEQKAQYREMKGKEFRGVSGFVPTGGGSGGGGGGGTVIRR